MTTELIDAPVSAIAAYSPFYAQLAELEAKNHALVFDYEDKKGNKEARSHVNSLRLTKGALERVRKEEKAESLRIGRAIDAEAEQIKARIEAMIAVHQLKIDEIEERERIRVLKHEAVIEWIETFGDECMDSASFKKVIGELEATEINDSLEEFIVAAAKAKDARLINLRARLAERLKYEEEQAELARLRAEAEARSQADRDAAIAKAAADRAKAEAEEKAQQEAAKARQAIADAEAKVKQEREAGERRELELKLQAEQAERRRVEQEQASALAATQAAKRAEQQRKQAILDEQARVAAAAQAEADAQAKREANKAHKAKINNAALAALVAGGLSEDCAKQCVVLIAGGKVPSIQINY